MIEKNQGKNMGFNIVINSTARALMGVVFVLLFGLGALLASTWHSGQPIYVMGQPFGFNANAFASLKSELDATRQSNTKLLGDALKRIEIQEQELQKWRSWYAQEQSRLQAQHQAAWYPVADVTFSKADRKSWKHRDSELTLALESLNGYTGELVLATNAPAPASRIRLSREKKFEVFSTPRWNYRVSTIEIFTDEAAVRVERQRR